MCNTSAIKLVHVINIFVTVNLNMDYLIYYIRRSKYMYDKMAIDLTFLFVY